MERIRSGRIATLAMVLALAGCGSSNPTTDNGGDNGGNNGGGNLSCTAGTKLSGKINGTDWCALSSLANYYSNLHQVVITGAGLIGSIGWDVTVSVTGVTATGTYPLNGTTAFALVTNSTGSGWSTLNAGSSGSVTFTTFSPTHVVGTYTLTAAPSTGATGTTSVTSGTFDLAMTAGN